MDTIDTQKLDELIREKRWDEARKFLEEFLKKPLSDEEKGQIYVQFAELYMDVMGRINRDYERALDEVIAELKKAKPAE